MRSGKCRGASAARRERAADRVCCEAWFLIFWRLTGAAQLVICPII